MSWLEINLLALALAVDAFSVAAVCGLVASGRGPMIRLVLSFGGFQTGLALLGAFLGLFLRSYIEAYDHFVAFGLLEVIGLRMIYCAFFKTASDLTDRDPTRGLTVLGLGIAVSIDAFGAGMGMAMTLTTLRLVIASLVIGVVAGLATWAGVRVGCAVQDKMGRKTEALGGLVLVALGIRMLWI